MKILAAIVTYNRCDLLERCVEHILAQSRPPNALLVINNGSTDGTEVMLASKGIEVITQENLGSAGGWHSAIQHALDNDFDAVWLMDDDGYPDTSALTHLEKSLIPRVACASSIVLQENCPSHFVFPFPILNKIGLPVIFANPRKIATVAELHAQAPDGIYPFVHLFNGALISTAAVREAGNVNRNYFIYGEEVDFFFRLQKTGSVISVLNAMHFHPDVSNRPYNPMKVYYYIKNSLILNSLYYDNIMLRNICMLGLIFFRLLKRNGLNFGLSLLAGKHRHVFISAISRGLAGKLGKDFNA